MKDRAKDGSLLEAAMRDHLANNLEIIEPGLTLVRIEFPLSNPHGADGSIDILARDDSGDLVVIELKKADQTARQALHELEKYVGLLASSQGVRIDQLRCILLSTTWHELLLPFSRFVSHVDFHVTGRHLHLGEHGYPSSSEPVQLLSLDPGLEVCPHHLDLTFTTQSARDKASTSAPAVLHELGVEDFVVLDMDYQGSSTNVIYPFSCYVVLATFRDSTRERARLLFPDETAEEPEDSPWWHEQLVLGELVERLSTESVDMSHPDKFKAIQNWAVSRAEGYGRYVASEIWTPSALCDLARAEGSRFSIEFKRRVRVAHLPAWIRMRTELAICLEGAGQWVELVAALLDEIEQRREAEIGVYAFLPHDVVGTLEHAARPGGDLGFMPKIDMPLRDGQETPIYSGCLCWDGVTHPKSLADTLGTVFDEPVDYFFANGIGALAEVDAQLCQLHGISYRLFEFWPKGVDRPTARLELTSDGRLERVPFDDDDPEIRPLADFIEENEAYLRELMNAFDEHVWRWPGD